jgi:hypothetical protein
MLDASKRSGRAEAIEGLKMIFQQGVREGSFRSLDATRTAEIFLGAVIITTEQQAFQGERRPVGESVSTLMELFLKGLEPRR